MIFNYLFILLNKWLSSQRGADPFSSVITELLLICSSPPPNNFSFLLWPHSVACGILVPPLGTEPGPLAVKAWSPNPCTTRAFPITFDLSQEVPECIGFFILYFLHLYSEFPKELEDYQIIWRTERMSHLKLIRTLLGLPRDRPYCVPVSCLYKSFSILDLHELQWTNLITELKKKCQSKGKQ